jgi:hypothetical protein
MASTLAPSSARDQIRAVGRLQQNRAVELAATVLSLGTNKLVARGAAWLKRHGLVKYVLPVLLVNEGFGAYRVYAAGGAFGWW